MRSRLRDRMMASMYQLGQVRFNFTNLMLVMHLNSGLYQLGDPFSGGGSFCCSVIVLRSLVKIVSTCQMFVGVELQGLE
jgi:hypothetical protein